MPTFFVYIVTDPAKTVLYTGMTNNLKKGSLNKKNQSIVEKLNSTIMEWPPLPDVQSNY